MPSPAESERISLALVTGRACLLHVYGWSLLPTRWSRVRRDGQHIPSVCEIRLVLQIPHVRCFINCPSDE